MNPEHPWMWWPWGGMWIFPIVMVVVMLIFLFVFSRRGAVDPGGGVRAGIMEKARFGDCVRDIEKNICEGRDY